MQYVIIKRRLMDGLKRYYRSSDSDNKNEEVVVMVVFILTVFLGASRGEEVVKMMLGDMRYEGVL